MHAIVLISALLTSACHGRRAQRSIRSDPAPAWQSHGHAHGGRLQNHGSRTSARSASSAYPAMAAVLGESARLVSPCTPEQAELLWRGGKVPKPEDGYWVALEPTNSNGSASGPDFDPALLTAPASIKKLLGVPDKMPKGNTPLAIGRIRWENINPPKIDILKSSVSKESPESDVYIGLVIDALLLKWSEHVQESSKAFDDLFAEGPFHAHTALRSRGFTESEEGMNWAAIVAGETPANFNVQLAALASAAQERVDMAMTGAAGPIDLAHALSVVSALEGLGDKISLSRPDDSS